jgi:hypothetical protein
MQTLAMPAEPFAERLVRPQRKAFEQGSAIQRERFRCAARGAGGGAKAGDVDVNPFGIDAHRLSDRAAQRQSVLAERAAHELLAKRDVGLFATASPDEFGETLARERKPLGKTQAGDDRHRLAAGKRNARAADATQFEGAKQAQLHRQTTPVSTGQRDWWPEAYQHEARAARGRHVGRRFFTRISRAPARHP